MGELMVWLAVGNDSSRDIHEAASFRMDHFDRGELIRTS
jgi:hypothetical protein